MKEGGQEEGEIDTSITDDASCKGDHIADEKHSQKGKQEADDPEGGEAGAAEQGISNDQPYEHQFHGKDPIDELAS